MYYNPYQAMQQPMFQAPMSGTYQQPMISTQMSTSIPGRTVANVSEISANDVPMDGSMAVFPKTDMSEVYVKKWQPNGTISTSIYRPMQVEETPSQGITLDDIQKSIEEIRTLLADKEVKTNARTKSVSESGK